MISLRFAAFVAFLMCHLTSAIPIDNGVLGIPQVNCEDKQVTMIFNTQKPFTGRIFVKGQSDVHECSMVYRGNTGSSVVFQVKEGSNCQMRRSRRLGPQRGVEQSMTVILSFHDTFITKVDKAYRCTCFFMEADKVVTSNLEVSMLPTTDLFDTAKMPACTYTVRRDSLNGPIVTYAKVGEILYHVWECDGDMFGMLVHSCFVDDDSNGGTSKFNLLDQNGCAVDPVILPDLTYNQELNRAYVEAQAFKFADKVTTYFQCAVSLCMKNDGACVGLTPPGNCSSNRRRFVRGVTTLDQEVFENRPVLKASDRAGVFTEDISAEKIYVLDLEDSPPPQNSDAVLYQPRGNGNVLPFAPYHEPPQSSLSQVCLSVYGFGFVLAVFLLVTTIAMVTAALMCYRQRAITAFKA